MEKRFERFTFQGEEYVRPAHLEPGDAQELQALEPLAVFEGRNFAAGAPFPPDAIYTLGPYTLEGEELERKKEKLRERWANYAPPPNVEEYGGREVLLALVEALRRVSFEIQRGDVELRLAPGWSDPLPPELVERALEKVISGPASFVWGVLGALLGDKGPSSPPAVRLPEHVLRAQVVTRATPPEADLFTGYTTEKELALREEARQRLADRGVIGASSASLTWNPTAEEEIVHRALLELFARRGVPASVRLSSSELLELCGKENNENELRAVKKALALLSSRPALLAFRYRPQRGTATRKADPWRKVETLGPLWDIARTSSEKTDRTLAWTITPGLQAMKEELGEEPFSIFFQVNREHGGDPALYRSEPAGLILRTKGEPAQVQADVIRLRNILGTYCARNKYTSGYRVEARLEQRDLQRDLHRADPEREPQLEGLSQVEALSVRYFIEQRDKGQRPAEIAQALELELKELRRLLRRARVNPKRKSPPSLRAVRERTARAFELLSAQGEPYRVSAYTFTRGAVRVALELA